MIEDLEMFEVVFSYIFDCKDKFTILFKLYLVFQFISNGCLGYSAEADPNAHMNKSLSKNKNPSDDKSFTSRNTRVELGGSWMTNKGDKDEMEVNKWNLKKLSFTPKTGRITERRCGLHDVDHNKNKHIHHKH